MPCPSPNRILHHHPRVARNTLRSVSRNPLPLFKTAVLTGHSSAASLPTGPVMAEPFISPFGLTICIGTESALVPEQPCNHSSHHVRSRYITRIATGLFRLTRWGRLTTPALSSKYRYTPSCLLHGLLCRTTTAGITFFRNSGFPFFTVAMTISPTPAAGRRLRRAPQPLTEMMYRLRAPELSQQFMTAPLSGCVSSSRLRVLESDGGSDKVGIHWEAEGHFELVARGTAAT